MSVEKLKETLENLSKTEYEKQFRVDYEKLSSEVQEAVAEAVETLATEYLTEPWNHPDVKYIQGQGKVWRLKIGGRGQTVDHRIFFDINDTGLLFLAVEHRDDAYQ